jgi:hypothetical protein
VLPNGTMAKQSDRVFADLRGSELGVPDGTEVNRPLLSQRGNSQRGNACF